MYHVPSMFSQLSGEADPLPHPPPPLTQNPGTAPEIAGQNQSINSK